MLKLTVKPGEYLLIGDDIKLVFAGGSSKNMRILVDAPQKYNIARSETLERYAASSDFESGIKYSPEQAISEEAQEKIKAILMAERKRIRKEKRQASNG
ncbi:MAG: carbon storage regulator [Lachnospiraceae bacterium]|nr:carbon storage regulator [Lachnospiraceae bacterium]